MDVHNIDAVLVKDMAERANGTVPVPEVLQNAPEVQPELAHEVVMPEVAQEEAPEVEKETKDNSSSQDKINPEIAEEVQKKASDSPIDEYGNPVEKPKMFSEEEVQRMIRDRLSRGRHMEQPAPPQHFPQPQPEATEPASEEAWDVQLKKFVKQTFQEMTREEQEVQWRTQEAQRQEDFQVKFSSGMSKYQDFHQVVQGKPITDSMMLAARNLENPAAFVYGAAKLHPQELERISRIADPYSQAAEVGRLHEKMVKSHRVASAAPKPLETPKGDVSTKHSTQPSIDSRILQHAAQKQQRGR